MCVSVVICLLLNEITATVKVALAKTDKKLTASCAVLSLVHNYDHTNLLPFSCCPLLQVFWWAEVSLSAISNFNYGCKSVWPSLEKECHVMLN